MKIKDIAHFLELLAPISFQESYDNSGLLLGDRNDEITQALITLDVTEEVIDEAIKSKSNFIIAHHPFIFNGIKRIGNNYWIDRCIRKAIKYDIAIYAIHTNLDNVNTGVNKKLVDILGLTNFELLAPKNNTLSKLTVFVPNNNKDEVQNALFDAGAGAIGNYDRCSFQLEGTGTFRGNELSNPSIGKVGEQEQVTETRIEVLVSNHKVKAVLKAMQEAHIYEEVAHYLTPLSNTSQEIGAGMVGYLPSAIPTEKFLTFLKDRMGLSMIRHTKLISKTIKKIAVCGGSGRFLLSDAIAEKVDIFITSDFKYHDFFEANNDIVIVDIGHYESEVCIKEFLFDVLTKKFTNFAFRLSEINTNPIKYL